MNLSHIDCDNIRDCNADPENLCSLWNGSQTALFKAAIECKIEERAEELSPFINLVRDLLHYGTAVVVAIGICFNTLSLVVLTRKNMRRLASSLFLSTLTIYDSLALLLNFMIGVIRGQNADANQSFMDSQALCKIHGVLVELFNLLSVWTIVTFTVERYFVVRFPLKAKMFTTKIILIIIGSSSLAVLIFSCHKIFFTGFEGDSVFGYTGCQTDRLQLPGIVYFYVAFNTWLPTLLIMTLNFAIIKEIRFHQARRDAMTTTGSRTDKKATRLLLTVSFSYLCLVLPLGIVQTIEVFWNAKVNSTTITSPAYVENKVVKIRLKWIRAFFFFFYQINFAVNFFLYVLSSSGARFRYNLRRLLGFRAPPLTSETMMEQTVTRNAVAPMQTPNENPE